MKKLLLLICFIFILSSCNSILNNTNEENISWTWTWTWTWTTELVNTWSISEQIKDENKNCILDNCIPLNADIKEENGYLIAQINKWAETDDYQNYTYKLSKNLDYFEVVLEEMMHKETTKVFKVWDSYIKSVDNAWCGWSNLDQKVYDKDNHEVSNYLLPEFTKDINIWNIVYKPSIVWKWGFGQPMDSYNAFRVLKDENWKDKIFKNENDFQLFVENDAFNVKKKLFKSYITQYSQYPWINVIYNSVWYDESSIRIVWLWTDESYLTKNIKANWDFIDLAVTNKIIWYYDEWNEWVFDSEWNRLKSLKSNVLPVFKMIKLNDKWNYLVYINDKFKIQSFAEMCKPVVYYYSKFNENNKLTLNLKKWDYFTKLIPELDNKSSWNFKSDNWKIIIENKKYDYLYYSLITLWYEHNKDWWIVKWTDIVKFFDDKLEKINFNEVEKKDFIDFWKDQFENDKYYFVSFKYKENLDKIIALNFAKKPWNEFRILLDSYELENYSDNIYWKYLYNNVWDEFDKNLIKKFNRGINNREVFEWGWVLVKSNETIIK